MGMISYVKVRDKIFNSLMRLLRDEKEKEQKTWRLSSSTTMDGELKKENAKVEGEERKGWEEVTQ